MKQYPQKYEAKDFVFFLHIPKTAGTSVTKALRAAFKEEVCISAAQMNSVRSHPREFFLQAELLCGHFTHDVYGRRLPKQPDFILSFLRDPVQHYISTFFHLKIDPTFTYTIRLIEDIELARDIHRFVADATIEEFLASSYSDFYTNFQTRYLVKGVSSDFPDLDDNALLPIAKSALDKMPFFGITDRYQDSLELLGAVMGLEKALRFSKTNAARNKPEGFSISDEALNEVKQRTAIDESLYQYAQTVFDQRFLDFKD